MNDGGIDDGALAQGQAFFLQITVDDREDRRRQLMLPSMCRKFMIVVSSGIGALKLRRANWRIGVISWSASSMVGSLRENQFCSR